MSGELRHYYRFFHHNRYNEARDTLDKFRKITEFILNPTRVILFISGDVKFILNALKTDRRKDFRGILDEYLGLFRTKEEAFSSSIMSSTSPSSSSWTAPSSTSSTSNSCVCLQYRPYSEFLLPWKQGSTVVKLIGMSAEETSSLNVISTIYLPYDHPDYPTMRVITTYFSMKEGPMWKNIRGMGLAYGLKVPFTFSH